MRRLTALPMHAVLCGIVLLWLAPGASAAPLAYDGTLRVVELDTGSGVFGGTSVGTIKSVDASGVTLTTPNGEAKLPASGFGPGPSGVTLGMTAERNLMDMQKGDVPATWANTDLLEALTGFRPNTPVAQGVQTFVDWYREHYKV